MHKGPTTPTKYHAQYQLMIKEIEDMREEVQRRQRQAQANACRAAFGGQLPSDLYNAYKAPQRRTNKIGIPLIPLEQNPYVSKL